MVTLNILWVLQAPPSLQYAIILIRNDYKIDYDDKSNEEKFSTDFLMFSRNYCFWIMKDNFYGKQSALPQMIVFDKLRYFDDLLPMDMNRNLHYQECKGYLEKSAFKDKGYYEIFL